VKLTTHLHLVPRSRMREAIPPLPNTPSWCGSELRKAQGQLYLYLMRIKCATSVLYEVHVLNENLYETEIRSGSSEFRYRQIFLYDGEHLRLPIPTTYVIRLSHSHRKQCFVIVKTSSLPTTGNTKIKP
jgi:hypothetical protein